MSEREPMDAQLTFAERQLELAFRWIAGLAGALFVTWFGIAYYLLR